MSANEVVDATLQLIYEHDLDGWKRVQSVSRMASDPHVRDAMKVLCFWEIENDVEMFRFMQEKFQVPSSALDITDDSKMDGEWNLLYRACAQLSPAITLMTRGAHEGGILQRWLFTSRSQKLVSGKL